jgi:serine/threonine protein kinase/tetratricopeptide (TPR) repeat protein
MSAPRLSEKSIFLAALDQASPEERAAYLDTACGDDHQLRAAVEALLAAYERLPAPATVAAARPAGESPGAWIGPYKLLQQIGEGGMGTVFMAEQTQPVQRKVALKVIKAGMDSRQVIARFEQERQALALMDHPHIARVLDAGTTGEPAAPPHPAVNTAGSPGRPYFVMELVKGVPITRYCDEHHLTPKARLELFVPICQAVQHAHQKGIIHRDLKPSNVLVCLYDGKPIPKVIDFGVAKATGRKLTERTLFTEFGAVVGTLEYMSPEQAELNNLDIDTRSDIYALGVLLYELLTGTTPLQAKRLKDTPLLEALRLIREEEPPKPSTRLSTTEELPAIAANRGLEPKKLSGAVRGELDWIVMKALEKDRDRRYETATGLARDLERFLHDEPVQACPPSAGYRLRKFLRRNKRPVLAASLVLVALLAGIIGTSWGLLQAVAERDEKDQARLAAEAHAIEAGKQAEAARRARNQEAAEAEKARRATKAAEAAAAKEAAEHKQAETVVRLFESLFGDLHPVEVTADLKDRLVQRLDELAANLDKEYAGQPLTRARLRLGLGITQLGLGNYDKAEVLFAGALQEFEQYLPADDRDVLICRSSLGESYRNAGKMPQAVPLLEQTLAQMKAKLGPDSLETLACMNNLALAYARLGRADEAVTLLEHVVAVRTKQFGVDHHSTLAGMNNLARAYGHAGRLDNAIALHQQVLERITALRGPDHPHTLITASDLAVAYHDAHQFGQAVPLLVAALARAKTKPGPDHIVTLTMMHNLAKVYHEMGRRKEALPLYEEALAKLQAKWPEHLITLAAMNNLGVAYLDAGKLDQAVPLLEKAGPLLAAKVGPDHPDRLANLMSLGTAYDRQELPDKALPLWEEGVQRVKAKLPAEHSFHYPAVFSLALLNHHNLGRSAAALPLLEEALGLTPDTPNDRRLEVLHELAAVHEALGNLEAAAALMAQAAALWPKRSPAGAEVAGPLAEQGRLLLLAKKPSDAEPLLREALALTAKLLPDHPYHFESMNLLGGVLAAQGKYADAEALLVDGYNGLKQLEPRLVSPPRHRLLEALERIVHFYEATRNADKAATWSQKLKDERQSEARALHQRGEDLMRRGQYLAAEATYRKWLRLDPHSSPGRAWLGTALMKQSKLTEAQTEFTEAIRLDPKRAFNHMALGVAHARLGQWKQAAAALDTALELEGHEHNWWYQAAALRLYVGDREGHGKACQALLKLAANTNDPILAAVTVQACLLAPEAGNDPATLAKLVDCAAGGIAKHPALRMLRHAKALADYRAGQFAAAAQQLEQCEPKADRDYGDAIIFATLAMARLGLKQTDQARAALANAQAILAKQVPDPGSGRPYAENWAHWLVCEILCREAEGLLKKTEN